MELLRSCRRIGKGFSTGCLLISSPDPAVLLIMPLVHLIRKTIGLLIIGWHGYAPDSSRAKRCLLFRYYDKAITAT